MIEKPLRQTSVKVTRSSLLSEYTDFEKKLLADGWHLSPPKTKVKRVRSPYPPAITLKQRKKNAGKASDLILHGILWHELPDADLLKSVWSDLKRFSQVK